AATSTAPRAKSAAAFMAATWSRGDLPAAAGAAAGVAPLAGAAPFAGAPFCAAPASLYWSWILTALAMSALSSTAVRPKIHARLVGDLTSDVPSGSVPLKFV